MFTEQIPFFHAIKWRKLTLIRLNKISKTTPWNIIELFDDVDDALLYWQHLFKYSPSPDHVKTRRVKVRGKPGEIRKAINKRYEALTKARKI